ncbi:MAG: zf-HC2 domain-containing protein [Verrucomicrobiota bacterium]
MNCAECRDNLVACVEGLLDREELLRCQTHLGSCVNCRNEYREIVALQQRLAARGQTAAQTALVASVMQRIREVQPKPSETIMNTLFKRWGFGLSAAVGLAAIILLALLISPRTQATAAEIMSRGAKAVAKLSSIHLRGQLRTYPAENFSYINHRLEFVPVELWKQFEPELKWRIDKPGRQAVMDGQSTVLYNNAGNTGYRIEMRTQSAFDTAWLHLIANLSGTISNELTNAQQKGWKLELTEQTAADGRLKSIVTVHAKSGLPDTEYLKNTFFDIADTRRVYRFDEQSELLEAVQVYLIRAEGEVLIFDLSQIDYNQPLASELWHLAIPADVTWDRAPQVLPDNEKYAAMTAEQAARTLFEACGREDWAEVEKFVSTLTPNFKKHLGGLQLVSLGEAFVSRAQNTNLQCFVPYEIKLRPIDLYLRLSNANAAKRFVITGQYDSQMKLQEEFFWTSEPPILSMDDASTRMSPAEVVKALCAASPKLDWLVIEKFMPANAVAKMKGQIAEAQQAKLDLRNLIPEMEAGDAFWSEAHAAWFVKVRNTPVKKWNLALRKDNPAGRWQLDGGL